MQIKPLRKDIEEYIDSHYLSRKWNKARLIFETDIRHPSLHTELMEPRWRGIYSFRLDKQYRALFFIIGSQVEVFRITKHYKK